MKKKLVLTAAVILLGFISYPLLYQQEKTDMRQS